MADTYFQITSPNTCGLVYDAGAASIVYCDAVAPSKIWPGAGMVNFEEFLTPAAAAARAQVLNPSYDPTPIFGPIVYSVDAESGSGSYNYGDAVTLTYTVSTSQAGTTVDSYQWKDGSGFPIPGATADTLSLGNATEAISGDYVCEATLSNTDGRVLVATGGFNVTVGSASGSFALTRTANNLSAGLYTASQGFDRTTSTLEFPTIPHNVTYDSADGFKTVGSPLVAGVLDFELFINGAYVKTFALPSGNGTYTFTF